MPKKLKKIIKLCSMVFVIGILTLLLPEKGAADYPIFSQRFTADPAAVVYNGRLYIYCSHDSDATPGQSTYNIPDITCISTDDLKNWTDHGEVFNAKRDSRWASVSWAPSIVYRNNKFYLYYGNGGNGIGVAVSDSPTGPFKDPLPGPLVSWNTPEYSLHKICGCLTPVFLLMMTDRLICTLVETDKTISELLSWAMI